MRSVFLVPVYNQIGELPRLLAELRESELACDELLFVNNGSTDGSAELVHTSGFPWLDVPQNRGIGYAFMIASDWALARNFDVFGVIAGNAKMLPREMPRLLEPLARGECDYVTGSRFLPGGAAPNLPAFRRWAIPLVNLYVAALYGHSVSDATCGYAAYRLALLRRASFDWHAPWLESYGFEYYLRGKVLRDPSLRKREVPVTMRYPTRGPYTKMRAFSGWYAMLRPWWRARFDGHGFAAATQAAATSGSQLERVSS
ncbi:MAG: glycosyltransferase family 2 protein [Polyangiales bacterium]